MTPQERLAHVYWLGESPCSGKSTVADRLATRHDISVYRCDDAYYEHIRRVDQARHPTFHRLATALPDGIWLRPVQQQIDDEISLYREEFDMIIDDLLAMPDDRPVIAEGAALLPEMISSLDIPFHRKLWMIPTEDFQRHHYGTREWRHDVLRETSDPERAWENWMLRDAGFACHVGEQANLLGESVLLIDGSIPIGAVVAKVQSHFALDS
jgi:2-phosphoglycerate kinase